MKKRVLAMLLTVVMVWSTVPAVAAYETPDFTDVPASHWAYTPIMEMAEKGIIKGVGKGRFDPNGKLTAEMFIVLLGRVIFPEITVEGTDWSGPYIAAAKENHLFLGTTVTDETIKNEITRYDVAKILQNSSAKGSGWVDRNDDDKSDYLQKNGISDERELGDMVFPKDFNVKDALADWEDIPEGYGYAVQYAYWTGLMRGDKTGCFNGADTLTRMEAATILQRLVAIKEKALLARQIRKERIQRELEALVGENGAALSQEELTELLVQINHDSFLWLSDGYYRDYRYSTQEERQEVLENLELPEEAFQTAWELAKKRQEDLYGARKALEGLNGETISSFTVTELSGRLRGYVDGKEVSSWRIRRMDERDLRRLMNEWGITAKMLEDAYWAAEEEVKAAWETNLRKNFEDATGDAAVIAYAAAYMAKAEGKKTFTFRARGGLYSNMFLGVDNYDNENVPLGLYGEDGRLVGQPKLRKWGYWEMDMDINTDNLNEMFTLKLMRPSTLPSSFGPEVGIQILPADTSPKTGNMNDLIAYEMFIKLDGRSVAQ